MWSILTFISSYPFLRRFLHVILDNNSRSCIIQKYHTCFGTFSLAIFIFNCFGMIKISHSTARFWLLLPCSVTHRLTWMRLVSLKKSLILPVNYSMPFFAGPSGIQISSVRLISVLPDLDLDASWTNYVNFTQVNIFTHVCIPLNILHFGDKCSRKSGYI